MNILACLSLALLAKSEAKQYETKAYLGIKGLQNDVDGNKIAGTGIDAQLYNSIDDVEGFDVDGFLGKGGDDTFLGAYATATASASAAASTAHTTVTTTSAHPTITPIPPIPCPDFCPIGCSSPGECGYDSDGDGVYDTWEIKAGTSPTDLCDYDPAMQIFDITRLEYRLADCDQDVFPNGWELENHYDPLDACDNPLYSGPKDALYTFIQDRVGTIVVRPHTVNATISTIEMFAGADIDTEQMIGSVMCMPEEPSDYSESKREVESVVVTATLTKGPGLMNLFEYNTSKNTLIVNISFEYGYGYDDFEESSDKNCIAIYGQSSSEETENKGSFRMSHSTVLDFPHGVVAEEAGETFQISPNALFDSNQRAIKINKVSSGAKIQISGVFSNHDSTKLGWTDKEKSGSVLYIESLNANSSVRFQEITASLNTAKYGAIFYLNEVEFIPDHKPNITFGNTSAIHYNKATSHGGVFYLHRTYPLSLTFDGEYVSNSADSGGIVSLSDGTSTISDDKYSDITDLFLKGNFTKNEARYMGAIVDIECIGILYCETSPENNFNNIMLYNIKSYDDAVFDQNKMTGLFGLFGDAIFYYSLKNTAVNFELNGLITNNEGKLLTLRNAMYEQKMGFTLSSTVRYSGQFINNTVSLGYFSEVAPYIDNLDDQYVPATRVILSGSFMNNRYEKSFQIYGYSQVHMTGIFVNCGHLHPELSNLYQDDGGLVTVFPSGDSSEVSKAFNFVEVGGGVFNHTLAMQAIRVIFPENYTNIPNPINGTGEPAYIRNIDSADFNHNGEIGPRNRACKDIFITQAQGSDTQAIVKLCDPSCSVVHPILSLCPHGCQDTIHGGHFCQKDTDGDGVGDEQEGMDNTNATDPCSFSHASQLALNQKVLGLDISFLTFTSLAYKNDDCDADGFTNYAEQSGKFPSGGVDTFDALLPCDNQIFNANSTATEYTYHLFEFLNNPIGRTYVQIFGKDTQVTSPFPQNSFAKELRIKTVNKCNTDPVTVTIDASGSDAIYHQKAYSINLIIDDTIFEKAPSSSWTGALYGEFSLLANPDHANTMSINNVTLKGFAESAFYYHHLHNFNITNTSVSYSNGFLQANNIIQKDDVNNIVRDCHFEYNDGTLFNIKDITSDVHLSDQIFSFSTNNVSQSGSFLNVDKQNSGEIMVKLTANNFTHNNATLLQMDNIENVTGIFRYNLIANNIGESGFASFSNVNWGDILSEGDNYTSNTATGSGGVFKFDKPKRNSNLRVEFILATFSSNYATDKGNDVYLMNSENTNSKLIVYGSNFEAPLTLESGGSSSVRNSIYIDQEGSILSPNPSLVFNINQAIFKGYVAAGAIKVIENGGNVTFWSNQVIFEECANEGTGIVSFEKSLGSLDIEMNQITFHNNTGTLFYVSNNYNLLVNSQVNVRINNCHFYENSFGTAISVYGGQSKQSYFSLVNSTFTSNSNMNRNVYLYGLKSALINDGTYFSNNTVLYEEYATNVYISRTKNIVMQALFDANKQVENSESYSGELESSKTCPTSVNLYIQNGADSFAMNLARFSNTTGGSYVWKSEDLKRGNGEFPENVFGNNIPDGSKKCRYGYACSGIIGCLDEQKCYKTDG